MKKYLLTGALITITATTLYATTAGSTVVDKMKAAAHSFTLATSLNPTDTGLTSDPVKGKKTGDILTAGEYNRILELMSEGGSGGSASGGSGAAAFVTYKNFSGTTTTIGKSEGIKSVANANGTPNFLAHDTLINFDEPLLTGDYAVIVSPSEDLSSILSVSRPTLDWVCMWNKISDSSLGVRCAYPGYGAYGNSIVSVAVIKGVGGGGSSNSAPAFYKCTNAQSLDATNAPCYGASRNGGAGTNKYRVVSCSNTDASGTYTAGGLLNFGDFMANKWSFHINNSNIACTDGSVLVIDIQGGGSTSSATCPSGFVAVGSYCIEPTMGPTNKTWYEAAGACADKGAQLCSWSEWAVACKKGILTDVQFGTTNGKYEWIDDYTGDAYQGIADPRVYSDCEYLSRAAPKTPNATTAYRCCSPKQ